MNKFLLASVLFAASSATFLTAGEVIAAPATQSTLSTADKSAAPAEEPADDLGAPELGRTGIVLAPGPVRLDKNGKPAHPKMPSKADLRADQLQMKADIEALAAGEAPVTREQRELARLRPHDRGLILKRINESLSAYKG
ncbi:hypothetical protein FAI40_05625 [Acetobacteraceae bacterium]|nr:hypothetical protein FAI40_05625 [Acetobacteraceae bacterium]